MKYAALTVKHVEIAVLTLALCVAGATGARAQSSANRGDVVGLVYDEMGTLVPGAAVAIVNSDTGLSRNVFSNDVGQYQFLRLDPGNYILTGTAPGFATTTVDGILLSVGASVAVDLTLQVRASTTTIEITVSPIESTATSGSTGISETAILNLPIDGRRFQDFATLTPTVQVEPQRSTLSFAGQRGVNGNVMLDGSDYNNPFFGGIRGGERANLIFTVPQSAVREFQVVTTGYSPEYGRSSGGMLNVITRGGSNTTHGSAFWQYRSGALSAVEPIFGLKSGETQQQFGGSVGGPIALNRWFYFGAIEFQQAHAPREVVFNRLIGVTPAAEQTEAFNFYKAQEESFELTNDATALTGRVDYQSGGNSLNVRYNFSDAEGKNAVNTGNALFPATNRAVSNDGTEKDRTHTATSGYIRFFSPDLLNDFRLTYTSEQRPRLANSETPYLDTIVGDVGNRNFLPTTEDDDRLQFSDALSWTRASHTFKFGFDYNRVNASQTFGFNQFGEYDFVIAGSTSEATMSTLEIMSLGGPTPNRFDHPGVSYSLQIGNLLANMDMRQSAFFLQDRWRVTPGLTLNYGVRWEGQFNPQPEATNDDLVNLVKGAWSPLGATLDPTRIPNQRAQWMPRFGFAWSPSGLDRRLVLRGHAGLFYASSPMLLFADGSNNFRATPGNLSVTLRSTSTATVYDQFRSVGVDLNAYGLDDLPTLSVDQITQAFATARGVESNPFSGSSVGFVASDFRNPRSFQMGMGLETALTGDTTAAVEVNYVNTVHLHRNRDHNMPAPIVRADDAAMRPFFGLRSRQRPIPSLGAFNVRESSARSMYRGVTFKLEHRGDTLTAGAFFTLAETFSDDDNERSAGSFDALDQFDLKSDYGYSRLDVRHLFNGYAVFSLPFGFNLSGKFVARSGLPVNPRASGDPNQDFTSFSDRPYRMPGVPFDRMSFRNRSVVTSNDLRIVKGFSVGGEARLEFSVEMFNVFNLDNVVYGSSLGDDNYGLGIDPATGARLAPDPGFLRLRLDDGTYDRSNRQMGSPFQAQIGVRFFS